MSVRRQQITEPVTESATRSVTLILAATAPWTNLPGVALGRLPTGQGTPVLFGLVACAGHPERRLDLYGEPGSDTYFASQALVWGDWIAVGFGWRLFLVSTAEWSVRTLELPSYFQEFRAESDYLLVVFGSGLGRVGLRGTVVWQNDALAIDGVEIDAIDAGVIRGRGEWDPPGGWRPFAVSLADGQPVGFRPPVA